MMILYSSVPLADVLVSHCLRPKVGCLRTCRRKVKSQSEAGEKAIVGGDFTACSGPIDSDDLTFVQHVGPIGMGQGNARGTMLNIRFYKINSSSLKPYRGKKA